MGLPQPVNAFRFEDYLAWEQNQPEKHEYVQGETFAMTGARRVHVIVSLNLASLFRSHLRGTPCQAFIADMKLYLAEADAAFYPDIMVSCDPRDRMADLYLCHPRLIVEVLSANTAAYDRGEKFAAYRKSASLEEYVIVDIDARRVESYRRTPENHWVLYEYAGDDACQFASIDLSLPLAAVFEDLAVMPDAGSTGA